MMWEASVSQPVRRWAKNELFVLKSSINTHTHTNTQDTEEFRLCVVESCRLTYNYS